MEGVGKDQECVCVRKRLGGGREKGRKNAINTPVDQQ